MNFSLRKNTAWLVIAMASYAAPALAQNNGAGNNAAQGNVTATAATTGYAGVPKTAADREAARYKNEQNLLGAPQTYGAGQTGGDTDDAQRQSLLDTQRMTVLGGAQGGQPAVGKTQRKAAAGNNGAVAMAAQGGQGGGAGNAAGGGAQRAAKNAYADPYGAKRAVYKTPW